MPYINGNYVPALADYQTAENANSLNLLACVDSNLAWFFTRYLIQKAISVFRWTIPETWNRNYLLYSIYCFGRVAIVNTDRFGVIPQACGLGGYNVFYQPSYAIVTNPLLRDTYMPRIDEQCTLLQLEPDYGGIMDLVRYYSNLMAQCAMCIGVNLTNSKVATAFMVDNQAKANAVKKAYDGVANGQPMIVVDKSLATDDGKLPWQTFQQDPKAQYLVTDLLSDMRKIEAMFDTDIGIPNANTDKRERLITDEVNANNVETYSKCALWLERLREGCSKSRDMFGINLDVDWRYPDQATEAATTGEEAAE